MEVEPLSRDRAMSLPTPRESGLPRPGVKVSLTQLLAASCSDVGLQEKDAARSQGYDPRYWPRIKSGEKRAYLDPVADLPEHAQCEFVTRWARQLGMDVTTREAKQRKALALAKAAIEFVQEAS